MSPVETGALRGLAEVRHALREVSRDAEKELKRELRASGRIVVDEARSRVAVSSGALRRSISVSAVGGGSAFRVQVRAPARRKSKKYPSGYRYGLRLEFEGRGSDALGPRAFLWPAVEDKREEVRARADEAMTRVIRKWTGAR